MPGKANRSCCISILTVNVIFISRPAVCVGPKYQLKSRGAVKGVSWNEDFEWMIQRRALSWWGAMDKEVMLD